MNETPPRYSAIHVRLAVLVTAGVLAVALLPRLGSLAVGLFSGAGEPPEDPYLARLIAIYHPVVHERDSVSKVAAKARTVYVVKRRDALEAVAALPPAVVTGDTVRIAGTPYLVPSPVAAFVVQQSGVIESQRIALVAADSALAKTVQAAALSDSAAAIADSIVAIKVEQPGRLVRAWRKVKTPLTFAGGLLVGAAGGYLAAKVLP